MILEKIETQLENKSSKNLKENNQKTIIIYICVCVYIDCFQLLSVTIEPNKLV